MLKKISLLNRFIFLIIVIFALTLSACGNDEDSDNGESSDTEAESTTSEIVIGLSISNLGNPFFQELRTGAESAADRLDVTLLVEDAADNAELQNTQINSLIDQDVDALLVNPVDAEEVVPAIEAANAADIPVFTIDRSAAGGEIVSHIASDNLAGGRMAGTHLADSLNGSGTVVELQGIPGTSAAQERGAGFNEAVDEYEDIEIIAQEVANFDRAEGEEVFTEILENNENIDGVFAHNDEMVLGAIAAAQEAGRAEDIVFIGFDAVDDAVAAVESGELLATIAQQPAEMGRLGVEAAVDYLNEEEVPDSIPVDLALITQ